MADISVIKMPDNSSYNIKDAAARESIAALPTDIQINGTSILNNRTANIPIASSNVLGVIKTKGSYGLALSNDGSLKIASAGEEAIKSASIYLNPIIPSTQHISTFYGLAKAAGDNTQSQSENTIGIYTDVAKGAIQKMLGVYDLLSTEEFTTAIAAHTVNSLFLMNGKLYKTTSAISIGEAVQVGANCTSVKIDEVFVKNTDYANANQAGISKINNTYGVDISVNGELMIKSAGSYSLKTGQNSFHPITPDKQHISVFYGLATAAGDST